MHIEKQQEDFYWLNEESKTFLSRGYIPDGMTVQQRYRQIADAAENILKIPGFSDKFYNYLAKGYYSLSSPIIANFGLKRALPISCVTGDTWINTANGGKMAKDIQVGDMVLTHKNRYRKVVDIIPTKEKGDIYKLKVYTRQTDLFITGNHLVLTNLGWVPVEELDPNTHLIATNGEVEYTPENKIIDLKEYVPYNFIVENGFIKKAIERNGRGIENNKSDTHVTYFSSISEFVEVDNDLAFALGIWFAEGSISINNNKKPNGVRITLNVKDESTANIWLRIMKNKFGANGSIHKTEIIRNGKLNSWINVNVNSRVVGEFFASFGKGAKYKQLPEWFLNLPKKLLETFWAAFSGMDGTYRNGNIKVTLSNPVLVMQLYAIGLKLGYRLSLQMKDKPGKFSTTPYVYTLNRRLTDKSRQRSGVKFNDGLVYCPIMHIEKTAKVEDVYDFTVEEDHSFSCAGVVVHNCFGSYITDDLNGIFDTVSEVAMMNKLGGGTSGYFGAIRARGSEITAGGKSNGTFSFLQIFDKVVSVVNQNGIRRGMFAGYIDIDHADIEEWVDIHTEGNPVQDIYWGVNVTNSFIEKVKNGDKAARNLWAKILSVKTATGIPYLHFIDNVNENKADVYLDKNMKIHASNMCMEISLPSSADESFVCCLMSMNLLHYDQWKDTDAVKTAVYFLDAVMSEFIEKARVIPKMEKAVRFAERHRALGLGVLGWHSYLQSKMIPFDGFEAMMQNAEIFKHIRQESYQGSKELAELLGEPELLKGYGRRNTTLMAVAPTKSSSFILGQVSQGVEPIKANLFIKDTAKVKTVFKNPFLEKLLAERGQDTPEVWESINKAGGSVAHLSFLTPREKDVFKTFEEINQMSIIQQAAQRQKFIDQGQSINLSIHPDTPLKDINALYLQAMELGVKGIYYQFSKSAAQSFNRELLQCSSCEA